MEKIKSGVEGMDEILHGGLPKGKNILVSGSAGTGKTMFSCQYLYNGAKEYDEHGVFLTLEESKEEIEDEFSSFGFDFTDLKKNDKIKFMQVHPFELKGIVKDLQKEIRRIDAERVVVDSISRLCMTYEEKGMMRRKISELTRILKSLGCTSLLTCESPFEDPNAVSRYSISEFVADGIILLRYLKTNSSRSRTIEVLKMRGSSHSEKVHPFEITENGLVVYPNEEVF